MKNKRLLATVVMVVILLGCAIKATAMGGMMPEKGEIPEDVVASTLIAGVDSEAQSISGNVMLNLPELPTGEITDERGDEP